MNETLFGVSLEEQVECVERELGYRERVYKRRVGEGKMTAQLAERELARMRAVLATLKAPPKGTAMARMLGPEHAAHADAIEAMLQQLLIALVRRAGGTLAIPVQEIDDTGGHVLAFRIDENRVFHFEVQQKQ